MGMGYIKKSEAQNIISALPVAIFNDVAMVSKKRVLKALDALGAYTFTTKLRRNKYSQIYCQNCENIIPVNVIAAHELDSCPFCSLPIKECKFDN